MVRYVKENFFQRYRTFESLDHLNGFCFLEVWLWEEADRRLHGTVREIVADRIGLDDTVRTSPGRTALPRHTV